MADVSVIIQMEMDSFMANFVSVMIENALMMKQKKYVEVCILTTEINKVLGFSPVSLCFYLSINFCTSFMNFI